MTLLSAFFFADAMRRSLIGAHAQDPVVPDGRSIPDRPLRIARLDDHLAALVVARSSRHADTVADGRTLPAPDRADERRAA
jgi:hypothetical protein